MFRFHFLEARNRLGLIVLSWSLTWFTCFIYKDMLLFLLIKPLLQICPGAYDSFISTDLTEVFSSYLLICTFISNQLIFFFFMYHLLSFVSPGLYDYELKKIRAIVFLIFFLWLLNLFILNKFIFPRAFSFFLTFHSISAEKILPIYFEVKISEYLNLYVFIFYLSALCFQFFFVIFLVLNGLRNKKKFIKRYRKIFLFFFFFISHSY